MRLHGRDGELAKIDHALADVRGGAQRTLAITGESGIGKSALLEAAAEAARERGLLVLGARAAEHERELPFGVITDALDGPLGAHDGAAPVADLAGMLPSARASNGKLSGMPTPPGAGSAAPAERYLIHRGISSLLERLGRRQPLALLLDDMQWADEASTELLLHLLRRPPQAPFLLLLALRPAIGGDHFLHAGRRVEGWVELRPAPLRNRAASALLPADLAPAARERILHEADGNPLFLRELARSSTTSPDDDEPVPETIAWALAQELDDLAADPRALLDGAAIAGDPFDPTIAAAVAGLDEASAHPALDALVAAEIVRPAAGHRFAFRHPFVHRVVSDATAQAWRGPADQRAATAHAAAGAPAALRAFHVERVATAGDEEAIALFEQAAHDSIAASPAAASHWHAAAVRLVPPGNDNRRAQLLLPLANALAAAGRRRESRAAFDEALELMEPANAPAAPSAAPASSASPSPDAPADGAAVSPNTTPAGSAVDQMRASGATAARLSAIAAATVSDLPAGALAPARARLVRALDHAVPAEQARLLHYRSTLALFEGDAAGVSVWSARAARELDRREDPPLRAAVTAMLGLGEAFHGEPADELLTRAATRLDAVDDAQLATMVDAAWTVGGNLTRLERHAVAVPILQRGLRLARETRQSHLLLHFHMLLVSSELPLLALDSAWEHADAAEEVARLQHQDHELAFALTRQARVLALRGRMAEAEEAARESEELLHGREAHGATATTRARNAIVLRRDDPAALLRALRDAAGKRLERVDRRAAAGTMLTAARAALALERRDEAERWAELAAAASGPAMPASAIRAQRAAAEVVLAAGDAPQAARLAAITVANAALQGLFEEQVEATILHGRALLAGNQRRPGLERLREAAAEAARFGAVTLRDAALEELRITGVRDEDRLGAR
ncbi:MAG TPA: AAA family ATPase [Conexibacter sp.]